MKLKKIVEVYKVLSKMSDHIYDYETAYKLYGINKKLKIQTEFFLAEEMKLVEKYAEKNEFGRPIIKADGRFNYADEEAKSRFVEEFTALGEVETDWNEEVLKLSATPMISVRQLEALDGFVEFGVEGE